MKEQGAKPATSPLIATLLTGLLGFVLVGCGGGDPPQPPASTSPKTTVAPPTAASSAAVTESEHQKFEKKYVELCVKGQQDNPDSPVKSDQQLGPTCECMAKTISKRLSKAEAVHFLDKKEIPIDIVMMGNAASDTCAQAGQ
ncbi:hypothetical protein SAMN02949497_2094 [Methylomagnum ishizawai]|uniref:Uncharacterized protein n=1 Tax=Methylomagnum ishizawai TaxID=1760988 RepID=A0A1Y6CWL7_9GAMM|nr:hypothetical protein [Methylomagnum ishizawai]SMF94761.1 hypothetical protein SAMN02949497_2094 [Methylomagnum ishizawai]